MGLVGRGTCFLSRRKREMGLLSTLWKVILMRLRGRHNVELVGLSVVAEEILKTRPAKFHDPQHPPQSRLTNI